MGFPKGFLWGGSISAAQIEGGWNEGGKSPVLVDYCTAGSTKERRQIWYLDKEGKRVHRNWEAVDELEEGCIHMGLKVVSTKRVLNSIEMFLR